MVAFIYPGSLESYGILRVSKIPEMIFQYYGKIQAIFDEAMGALCQLIIRNLKKESRIILNWH